VSVGSAAGKKLTVTFFSAGENGGRFTVKKYHSELSTDSAVTADGWRHDRVQLLPLNPAFEPIALEVGDPLLQDPEVAVGLLRFSGVGDHR